MWATELPEKIINRWESVRLSEKTSHLLESESLYKEIQKEENYPCVIEIFKACAHDRDLVYEKQKLVALIVKIIKPQDLQEAIAGKAQLICQTLKDRGVFNIIHEDQPKSALKLHPNIREIGSASLNERDNSKEIFSSFCDSVHKRQKDNSKALQEIEEYRDVIIKYLCTDIISLPQDSIKSHKVSITELLQFVKDTLELARSLHIRGFFLVLFEILYDKQIDIINKYLNEYFPLLDVNAENCLTLAHILHLPLLQYAASFYAKKSLDDEKTVNLFQALVTKSPKVSPKVLLGPKHNNLISHLFSKLTFKDIKQIKNKNNIHRSLAQSNCTKLINKQPEQITLCCQDAEEKLFVNPKLLALVVPNFFNQHKIENNVVTLNYSKKSIEVLNNYILTKKIDNKNVKIIDENLKLVEELLDLAHKWQLEGLTQSIEKYLIRHALSCETADKFFKLAETYHLQALKYSIQYYKDAEDSTLKDIKNPITHAIRIKLFSILTKTEDFIKWHKFLVGHLLDLLTYNDMLKLKFSNEVPHWLKSHEIVEMHQDLKESDETKENSFERFRKALFLASPKLCRLFLEKDWTTTASYESEAIKTVFEHMVEKAADNKTFMTLKKNLSEENFSKTIMDIIFLADAWQLYGLQKEIENYLIKHEIDESNAAQFLKLLVSTNLEKKAKYEIGYLKEDAKEITIKSYADVKACLEDPYSIRGIIVDKSFLLNEESIESLVKCCTSLRKLKLSHPVEETNLDSIGQLKHLEELYLKCEHPQNLLENISNLEKLKKLVLKSESFDKNFLQSLFFHPSLEFLDLRSSKVYFNITPLLSMPKLKELYLHGSLLLDLENMHAASLLIKSGVKIYKNNVKYFNEIDGKSLEESFTHYLQNYSSENIMEDIFILDMITEENCALFLDLAKKFKLKKLEYAAHFYSEPNVMTNDPNIAFEWLTILAKQEKLASILPKLTTHLLNSSALNIELFNNLKNSYGLEELSKILISQEVTFEGWDRCIEIAQNFPELTKLLKRAEYCKNGPQKSNKIIINCEDDLKNCLKNPSKCRSISIQDYLQGLSKLSYACDSIKTLWIKNKNWVKPKSNEIRHLARFKKLKELSLIGLTNWKVKELLGAIKELKDLRTLSIIFPPKFSEQLKFFKGLPEAAPQIECLYVNQLMPDFKEMPNLSTLYLCGEQAIKMDDLKDLLNLKKLKSVTLPLVQLLLLEFSKVKPILEALLQKGVCIEFNPDIEGVPPYIVDQKVLDLFFGTN